MRYAIYLLDRICFVYLIKLMPLALDGFLHLCCHMIGVALHADVVFYANELDEIGLIMRYLNIPC
jgi:hypothetical protein